MDDVNPLLPGGPPWGFWFGQIFAGILLTAALVVVAVLLIRYLVVATRAAQLYLDLNRPTTPAAAAPVPPVAPTPAPAAAPAADPTPPNVPAGTKPTRTRAPKPPAAL